MQLTDQLAAIMPTALTGTVIRTVGTTIAVAGFPAPIGATVRIARQTGDDVEGEVVGFRDDATLVYPFGDLAGVRRGNQARLVRTTRYIRVGHELLGRVVNARVECVDDRPQPALADRVAVDRAPPRPIERPRIDKPLSTGVRAIDGLLTCGMGQRLGIFSGSGVGKSVLLGMMSRYTAADVNVIALIGERGREMNDFIERDLGPEGLARSVVVIATSDEPAVIRVRAALVATAIAEYFRDAGKNVLLLMDSVTRVAMAQREIGLAAGEPPTTRGYTPSVFALLPKLLERAGRSALGSITAFYSVLVEGDDENEPIADCVRGLLDGHVWLSRRIAERGHYPAIDVLRSISRLANELSTPDEKKARQVVRELLAAHAENEDLITIGAYRKGANRTLDAAVEMREEIHRLLKQQVEEKVEIAQVREALIELAGKCVTRMNAAPVTMGTQQQMPPMQPQRQGSVIKK
jgi:flagellum-specific ATP synthase